MVAGNAVCGRNGAMRKLEVSWPNLLARAGWQRSEWHQTSTVEKTAADVNWCGAKRRRVRVRPMEVRLKVSFVPMAMGGPDAKKP